MAETTLTDYAAAGAISAVAGVARLTATADAAYTLANASGLTTDAVKKDISNESASAYHTVTGNFVRGNLACTSIIIAPGGNVRLMATANAAWRVMSNNRATLL